MKKLLLSAILASLATSAIAMPINSGNVDETIVFPDTKTSYLKQAQNVNQAELLKLTADSDKNSVRSVLGNPHFKEFATTNWNYWLGVQDIQTNKFAECQLQVHFGDKDNPNTNYYWNDGECSKLMTKKIKPKVITQVVEKEVIKEVPVEVIKEVPVEVVKEVQVPTVINLDSNVLFKIGSSELSDKAVNEILAKTADIKANIDKVKSVEVVGHTDRIGGELQNEKLGLERAKKVASLLHAKLNLPVGVITVESRGEYEPITSCSDNLPKSKLIECLSPDRRVELKITFQ